MRSEAEIIRAIPLLKHHANKVCLLEPEFATQTGFAVLALEWALGGKDGDSLQKLLDGVRKIKAACDAQRN